MTQINLCTLYRGAVEKVGTLLYNLNTCLSFPTNIVSELQLCLEKVEIAFGIQSANQKLVSPIKWIEVST